MSTTTTLEHSPSRMLWLTRSRRSGSPERSPQKFFKGLVSKRKRQATVSDEPPLPPLPPPKDENSWRHSHLLYDSDYNPYMTMSHDSVNTIPYPPVYIPAADEYPVSPFERQAPRRILSLEEKARIRLEAEKEKEFEERMALQEEEERQSRLKAEKAEILRRSQEDEKMRKAKVERDLQKAAAKRMERLQAEREEEEARIQEMEERKRLERERKLAESQRWQAWRVEQEKLRENTALKKDDEKRQTEEQKRIKRRQLYDRLKADSTEGVLLAGWLSIQNPQAMTWKRRYFILDGQDLKLYKSQGEVAQPIDIIHIANIRAVRDGGDVSEEEPEFIPFSFAVDEAEGCCWSIFTDDQESKDNLIAVLVCTVDNNGASAGYSSFFSRIPRLRN